MEDGNSSSPLEESDETDSVESNDSWSDYFELKSEGRIDPHAPYLVFCRKIHLRHALSGPDCHTDFVVGKVSTMLSKGERLLNLTWIGNRHPISTFPR